MVVSRFSRKKMMEIRKTVGEMVKFWKRIGQRIKSNFGIFIWLVVLTILKNISQWEGLSHILWKIKHV
jgi:hypothetical protein